jgi:hypothetical protein
MYAVGTLHMYHKAMECTAAACMYAVGTLHMYNFIFYQQFLKPVSMLFGFANKSFCWKWGLELKQLLFDCATAPLR